MTLGGRRNRRTPGHRHVRSVIARDAVSLARIVLIVGLSSSCVDLEEARERARPEEHTLRISATGLGWEHAGSVSPSRGGEDSVVAAAEAALRGGRPWRAL